MWIVFLFARFIIFCGRLSTLSFSTLSFSLFRLHQGLDILYLYFTSLHFRQRNARISTTTRKL
jgi:hypothetical protein